MSLLRVLRSIAFVVVSSGLGCAEWPSGYALEVDNQSTVTIRDIQVELIGVRTEVIESVGAGSKDVQLDFASSIPAIAQISWRVEDAAHQQEVSLRTWQSNDIVDGTLRVRFTTEVNVLVTFEDAPGVVGETIDNAVEARRWLSQELRIESSGERVWTVGLSKLGHRELMKVADSAEDTIETADFLRSMCSLIAYEGVTIGSEETRSIDRQEYCFSAIDDQYLLVELCQESAPDKVLEEEVPEVSGEDDSD